MIRKYSNNKIPFGLKDDKLVEVSEVDQGLACECVCPSCKRKLQANKGRIVAHYFSHDPSSQAKGCESAFETSIHLMAKQILSEEGSLNTPGLTITQRKADADGQVHEESATIEMEGKRFFDRVDLEKMLETIRPDIIAYIDGKALLIEVAVTSFADGKKKQLIRNLGLPALEMDLSSVCYTTTKDDLRNLITGPKAKIKWLSNPDALSVKRKLQATLEEKVRLINEGIHNTLRKSREDVARALQQAGRKAIDSNRTKLLSSVQKYDARWFVCEACRHVFRLAIHDAPSSILSTPCPECEHAVSAKSVG
ncbi:MAG: hypothetical protein Q7U82_00880 [Gammaproteobacteria bacterium]|nr:hypothetical protein [Gammaproteobacteria bacterium]